MFGLTVGELVFIAVILFIIFSASRMATLGNALGAFLHSFKKASKGDAFVDVTPRKAPRVIDAPKR